MRSSHRRTARTVAVLLVLGLGGAHRASAVPVTLPDDAAITSPGGTTAVDVEIVGVTGVEAAAVSITFDPAVVVVPNPASVALGTVASTCNPPIVNLTTPGRATVTLSCTTPVSGSGTLLVITFQGVGPGVSPLAFAATADIPGGCQLNEGVPSCEAVDGQIGVGPAPPTATPTSTPTVTPTDVPTPTLAPAPATLVLRRAKLRADTARRPGRDNGALRLDGLINVNPPFGGFAVDLQTAGLGLRVVAGDIDVALSWPAASCHTGITGRGPRISCEVEDASGQRRATFRPTREPNLFAATILARRLSLPTPPLTADSVVATLTTRSFQRQDEIGSCALRGARRRLVVCRESGIVATPTPRGTVGP